ncbi:MAG: hypothetical protein GX321_06865 [Clostridiales bacterium]|nr:hypothetical protein [Clostridiales bacterium]
MKKSILFIFALIATISLYSCSKPKTGEEPANIDNIIENERDQTDTLDDEAIASDNDEIEDKDSADQNDTIIPREEPAKLTLMLEGMTEEVDASLYHSPLGYQIVYDNERFELTSLENGKDTYNVTNPDPEKYPDVYFKISRPDVSSLALDEYDNNQESITTLDGDKVAYIGQVTIGTYTARHFKFITGHDWDSIIRNYYIINSDDSDTIKYIIESQYFVEAEEGYGARISAMLETFK